MIVPWLSWKVRQCKIFQADIVTNLRFELLVQIADDLEGLWLGLRQANTILFSTKTLCVKLLPLGRLSASPQWSRTFPLSGLLAGPWPTSCVLLQHPYQ